jgi:hypothetical protein
VLPAAVHSNLCFTAGNYPYLEYAVFKNISIDAKAATICHLKQVPAGLGGTEFD